MKKLHVLFLCGWYPSRVLQTNGDFVKRHAKAVATKHLVSVLHIISDPKASKSIEIETKKSENLSSYIAYVKSTKNPLLKFVRFWKAYKLLLKQIGSFDVVHLHEIFPFGLFALHQKSKHKKPFIVTEHWTGYLNSKKLSWLHKTLVKLITKRAAFVCPVGKNLENALKRFGVVANFNMVPNVVDTQLFSIKDKKEKLPFSILHISDLNDDHKNVSGMLEAAKMLENMNFDFHWAFVGGSHLPYQSKIEELHLNEKLISFQEHLPHYQISERLQEANLLVLFSNYENLPCVILESFSCGTPVVSTNVGGISEFFPENFGTLIEKGNVKELASAIVDFANKNGVNSNEMHLYATQNFGIEKVATNFSNLYHKALNE